MMRVMKAYGSIRTYGKCSVLRAGNGRKIIVAIRVKNRKANRQKEVL